MNYRPSTSSKKGPVVGTRGSDGCAIEWQWCDMVGELKVKRSEENIGTNPSGVCAGRVQQPG